MSDDYGKTLEELAAKWKQEKKDNPCPSCGHCPTCGRSGNQLVPYVPYYPAYPMHPWAWGQPYITWTATLANV